MAWWPARLGARGLAPGAERLRTRRPSDPLFRLQWGLENRGQAVTGGRGGRPGADIAVRGAWRLERGRPEVVVAILDSGVDAGHPDLRGQLLRRPPGESWDFGEDGEEEPAGELPPRDATGHGTHVAGIIAAAADGAGIVGVAPGCRLMPLRVDLRDGTVEAHAAAIRFVAERALAESRRRRYVLNGSWNVGGGWDCGEGRDVGCGEAGGCSPALEAALAAAAAAEVVLVFAAGNGGEPAAGYPARHPEVLAVAATDPWDRLWEGSNHGDGVDLAAPGETIYSSFPVYLLSGRSPYLFRSGTSMAAAFVSGVAALVLSAAPELPAAVVRQILVASCDDVEAGAPERRLGAGRVNAACAVAAALGG